MISGGVLLSCGDQFNGRLGRRTNRVPMKKFGLVAIDDPVLAVTVGWKHVLAMTSIKVGALIGPVGHGSGFNSANFKSILWIDFLSSSCEIALGEFRRTPLVISQHWFR